MKGRKNKKFRNTLKFYEHNFGFHAPYKVLVDGNFLARCNKIGLNLEKKLYTIFKKKMMISTTKCISNELHLLGSEFTEVHEASKELYRQFCYHQVALQPSDCILKHVGSNNKPHYIIATCDKKLIKILDKIPKIPILTFVSDNVIEFRDPSKATMKLIEKKDEGKYEPSEREKVVIDEFKKKERIEEIKEKLEKLRKLRYKLGIKAKKKAKGPNPLSCKKRKKNNNFNEEN